MILALIELEQAKPTVLSLEMLTMAHTLGAELNLPVHAALIGDDVEDSAEELGKYGVAQVYVVEDGDLEAYAPDAWAKCLVDVIKMDNPAVVLGTGSDRGQEVMARVGARLDLPLCANAMQIETGGSYKIVRVTWGGSLHEEISLTAPIKLLTIAPHVVDITPEVDGDEPEIVFVDVDLGENDLRVRVVGHIAPSKEGVSLGDADAVIGGGRGVGSGEGFAPLEELAKLLEGAVGCSRAVTNHGWRPHSDQIGQTGERIAPQLYIACGISGASQHMAGCSGAKHLLAINLDDEAPILAKADYAVIGDLHEVIPAISAEIRRRQ